MQNLTIDAGWTADQLYALFAQRRHDPTFGSNFSNLTPWSVDTCVQNVQNGRWLPFLVKDLSPYPVTVAFHYLHDVDAENGITWVSGYVMPEVRGHDPLTVLYKQAMWEVARQHILYTLGYQHIFAYVMATNRGGKHWAAVCCKLTEVGTLSHAVPEGNSMAHVVVYCHDAADVALCRETAQRLMPHGEWV